MKSIKIIMIALFVIVCFGFVASCESARLKTDAALYDNAGDYITDETKEVYRTGNATPYWDETLPTEYVFALRTQEEFAAVIKEESAFECDFDSEMIVVYTFMTMVGDSDHFKIKRIKKEGTDLKIVFELSTKHGFSEKWASTPHQRWFLLKMKKVDCAEIKVHL